MKPGRGVEIWAEEEPIIYVCIYLTDSSARSAVIAPIMIYMFSVSPPAHRGPRMVAKPPTERRTPWLKPEEQTRDITAQHINQGSRLKKKLHELSRKILLLKAKRSINILCVVCFCESTRWCRSSPWVFSAVIFEKRETWATATNGNPNTCRNTPMMNSVSCQG